jgi:hypothetical protein
LIRISSSAERPGDAFVAIPYHGYWFSIDDRDPASKNLFSFILLLFTFVETGSKDITPVWRSQRRDERPVGRVT